METNIIRSKQISQIKHEKRLTIHHLKQKKIKNIKIKITKL